MNSISPCDLEFLSSYFIHLLIQFINSFICSLAHSYSFVLVVEGAN